MAHNCDFCDALCYCDWDDTFGLPQPGDCRHLTECPEFTVDAAEDLEELDAGEDYEDFEPMPGVGS